MAKLMTWVDSHRGAVQLQPNSSLPGRHSKAHCSHKDGENMTWIGSLFFLHIMTHMDIATTRPKRPKGRFSENKLPQGCLKQVGGFKATFGNQLFKADIYSLRNERIRKNIY